MSRVMALNDKGELTWCSANPEDRGKGRCNHIKHQEEGMTQEEFITSVSKEMQENYERKEDLNDYNKAEKISDQEIDDLYNQISSLAGEELTEENLMDILANLDPEVNRKIQEIGFRAATYFDIPVIGDPDYEEKNLKNQIIFTNLPDYGIAGKNSSIQQVFDKIGEVPTINGIKEIKGNYKEGLSEDDYFDKLFSGRIASVEKTVSVALPGYMSKLCYYGLSSSKVVYDCGNKDSKGVIDCKIPGTDVCYQCLKKSGQSKYKPGYMIGGDISTHITEAWYQGSMKKVHAIYKDQIVEVKG